MARWRSFRLGRELILPLLCVRYRWQWRWLSNERIHRSILPRRRISDQYFCCGGHRNGSIEFGRELANSNGFESQRALLRFEGVASPMTFFFHRFSRKRVARQPASSIIFVRTL